MRSLGDAHAWRELLPAAPGAILVTSDGPELVIGVGLEANRAIGSVGTHRPKRGGHARGEGQECCRLPFLAVEQVVPEAVVRERVGPQCYTGDLLPGSGEAGRLLPDRAAQGFPLAPGLAIEVKVTQAATQALCERRE